MGSDLRWCTATSVQATWSWRRIKLAFNVRASIVVMVGNTVVLTVECVSGWKHWVFEGGVRSAAFVYSSTLANPGSINAGTVDTLLSCFLDSMIGLFHSVDWLPTLTHLAQAPTTK